MIDILKDIKQESLSLGSLGEVSVQVVEDNKIEAQGRVPQDLELFKDHFPAFPVLPGVLTVDILKKIIEFSIDSSQWQFESVCRVKFSSYLRPGDVWRSELILKKIENEVITWQGRVLGTEKAAASAQLQFKKVK